MYLHSEGAGWSRNFYTPIEDGEIIIKGKDYRGSKRKKEKYIICGGELAESIEQNHHIKTHTVFGKFRKTYLRGSLRKEEYYERDWRIKWKGLFLKQIGKHHILERYSSGGSMSREIVYWKNGKLMYNLGKGNKNILVFNKNGILMAKIYLDKGLPIYSGSYGLHLDLGKIKKLEAVFGGDWYYELYDARGNVRSWLKGRSMRPEEGVKNGRKLYFLRGIQVPKKVIIGKYVASYILSYPNSTIRSEMLKRYGIDRVVQELQGESLEKRGEYELLQFPIPGGREPDNNMKVLKMRCPSTKIYYTLRVPPECQNIHDAINWTYGLDLPEIRDSQKEVEIIAAT
ncbi:MAG: hypothetical protein XD75_0037 [Parcubacteria bacterium 33_209]|nr:MAG: hypothetical protein XD75_0037 [Parcubacteria bacterium 33_209]